MTSRLNGRNPLPKYLLIAIIATTAWAAASPARAQSDYRGSWLLQPDAAGVGAVTACVTSTGDVVVDGTGVRSISGTIEYASGTTDANGRIDLTVRTLNDSTGTDRTRAFTGVLDAASGLGSGDASLTDTSGPDINTTWSGVRTSTQNQCSGPGAIPLSLAVSSLPRALVGFSYAAVLSGKGGIPPLVLSVSGLPAGLTFDAVIGQITGTPEGGTAGTYTLDITVTDDAGNTGGGQLVLVVGIASAGDDPLTPTFFFPCGTIGFAAGLATALGLCILRISPTRSGGGRRTPQRPLPVESIADAVDGADDAG